jgi:dTDP-glucose 4,6-dehydratase
LDIRIARIFNTYGSRMRVNDGRAIPAFMGQVLRGKSLTVFGDGSKTRSFCYVDDMVEGIYKLLHSNYTKPMNLGNPEEIALIDFAKEIIAMGGNENKIVFKPLPINDPIKRKPDITKAIKILNWQSLVSRKKGLEYAFNYFKSLSLEKLNTKENKFA